MVKKILTPSPVSKKIKKAKKTVIEPTQKTEPQIPEYEYHMKVRMNDQVFECDTNNLEEAIMAIKPAVLKTKIQFEITKDGKLCERQVFVNRGKMIFRNSMFLKTFIRFFIFKNV